MANSLFYTQLNPTESVFYHNKDVFAVSATWNRPGESKAKRQDWNNRDNTERQACWLLRELHTH